MLGAAAAAESFSRWVDVVVGRRFGTARRATTRGRLAVVVRGTVRRGRGRAFAVFALHLRAGTATNLQRRIVQVFVLLLRRVAAATARRLMQLLGPAGGRLAGTGGSAS